jgi:hypothetical protein
VGELFAAEIAAMRDRLSTAEVQAHYARGLMTAQEVFEAALRASYGRPDVRAELARQFHASPDELARGIGESLDEYTRRESLPLDAEAEPLYGPTNLNKNGNPDPRREEP